MCTQQKEVLATVCLLDVVSLRFTVESWDNNNNIALATPCQDYDCTKIEGIRVPVAYDVHKYDKLEKQQQQQKFKRQLRVLWYVDLGQIGDDNKILQ